MARPGGVAYLSKILTFLLLACVLAACEPSAGTGDEPAGTVGLCGEDGQLVADLHGALQANLHWQADVIACEGMPRPEGRGARLRFAGPATQDSAKRSLAFILAMPDLVRGERGRELPANVTLIEEGSGRFFATADTESCWADIEEHERTRNGSDSNYRISGVLYCVAPLAELNGRASVTLTELQFTGRLNWQPPR